MPQTPGEAHISTSGKRNSESTEYYDMADSDEDNENPPPLIPASDSDDEETQKNTECERKLTTKQRTWLNHELNAQDTEFEHSRQQLLHTTATQYRPELAIIGGIKESNLEK